MNYMAAAVVSAIVLGVSFNKRTDSRLLQVAIFIDLVTFIGHQFWICLVLIPVTATSNYAPANLKLVQVGGLSVKPLFCHP